MTGTLLSLGHGYCARALARRLGPGWRIVGTTRSGEKADALRAEGVEPRLWPGSDLSADIAGATHILASAGPGSEGDPFVPEIGKVLGKARPAWVGYLSTTGVYGDHGGGWVDEDTPLTPSTERGKRRVQAEAQWRAAAQAGGWPLRIFRLAGIYGPGRGPFERLRAGTARRIIKPGQVFSRIHVDDIAQVLAASMVQSGGGTIAGVAADNASAAGNGAGGRTDAAAGLAPPGGTGARVYNLCDDDPAPPQDVLLHAAHLLGLPPPAEVAYDDAEMSPMARSFYAENKRVSNARIKDELGIALLYPTYREGLRALIDDEGGAS